MSNLLDRKTSPVFITASDIKTKQLESFPKPEHGTVTWKTLFSSGLTPSDSLTAGIATCPPQSGYLAHHCHEQAELYFILEGKGMMSVDGDNREVGKGDVIFVPGNAEHGIRNVGKRELNWFYCFAADRFDDVVYRWSAVKAKL